MLQNVSTSQNPYNWCPSCRHLVVSAHASTSCRHLHRCRHLSRCWHMSAHPSIRIKSTWLVSQVQARAGIYMCRHLFQVLTHASTSQYPNKKIHMSGIQGVSTCRHPDVLALVGNLSCVDTFTGADTCQYIPSFNPKFPWDWYPRCRNMSERRCVTSVGTYLRFGNFPGVDTWQHIPASKYMYSPYD